MQRCLAINPLRFDGVAIEVVSLRICTRWYSVCEGQSQKQQAGEHHCARSKNGQSLVVVKTRQTLPQVVVGVDVTNGYLPTCLPTVSAAVHE